ncbi:MAG: 16S rRNA (guanine(966)-N(2))-methyltransferase RsmD [Myxococcaceae bacterium]
MRIGAGTARGRAIEGPGPKSKDIRPTADRVRETLFNVLGQWLEGFKVLDLYAGTGAFALEAISRGAVSAVLVDSGREALTLCRANAEGLGFTPQVEILGMPVAKALPRLKGRQFEVVFADPPYAAQVVPDLLTGVVEAEVLASGGRLLVEHDKREVSPAEFGPLVKDDERKFGDTVVSFYRAP